MVRRTFGLILLASCGDAGGFPDAAVPDAPLTGLFNLTWTVVDQNSAPLACDRIAAQAMTVLARNVAYDGGETQIFTCSTGMGTSQRVIAGTFEFAFELSGTFGLLARSAAQYNVDVPADGNVTLEPAVFQVEAIGGVALQLSANKTGGNCGAANANGAGIDGFTITMNRNSDTACAPLTLTVSAGATQPGGTYTIDCATPAVFGCIEADQVITATGIDSDGYTLHIKGKINNKDCYLNNDSIQVPPLQKTLMRTLNLAQQTSTAGCG
jgi:hypothetical protein